jgi:hypothetical protein
LLALKRNAEAGTLVWYQAVDGQRFAGRLICFHSSVTGEFVEVQWLHTGATGTCELSRVSRLIVTFVGPVEGGPLVWRR